MGIYIYLYLYIYIYIYIYILILYYACCMAHIKKTHGKTIQTNNSVHVDPSKPGWGSARKGALRPATATSGGISTTRHVQ